MAAVFYSGNSQAIGWPLSGTTELSDSQTMRIDSHNEQYDNSAIRNKRNKRFVEQFVENCKATQKTPEFTAFSQPANPKGPEVQKGLCCCHKRPSPGRSGNSTAGPRTLQQTDHRMTLRRSGSITSRSERSAVWLINHYIRSSIHRKRMTTQSERYSPTNSSGNMLPPYKPARKTRRWFLRFSCCHS